MRSTAQRGLEHRKQAAASAENGGQRRRSCVLPRPGRRPAAHGSPDARGHVEVVRTTRALLLIDADVGRLVQVASRARAPCTASGTLRSAPPFSETERWRQRPLLRSRLVHLLARWGLKPQHHSSPLPTAPTARPRRGGVPVALAASLGGADVGSRYRSGRRRRAGFPNMAAFYHSADLAR